MMNKEREVIKQMLEVLQEVYWSSRSEKHDDAITSAKEILAQKEQDEQKENERLHRQSAVLLREKSKAEAEAKEWFTKYQELAASSAQPEQEPVAYVNDQYSRDGHNDEISALLPVGTKLYTAPQCKPLTHEQRLDVMTKFEKHRMKWDDLAILIDLVEDAHNIKGEQE